MTLAQNLAGMGAIVLAFGLLFGVVYLAAQRLEIHPEFRRKAVHVGMGLFVLPLPWLFDSTWPVWCLGALAVCGLMLLRTLPRRADGAGSVLGGVDRQSLGEVFFPIAVAVLFQLSSGDWFIYVVPIAILALADATAALIGMRYGTLPYLTTDGAKSVEGSVAFFFVAFMTVLIPLLLWTDVPRAETLLLSLTIALLVMLFEGISWGGIDNLLVPFGAYAFLQGYVDMSAGQLLFRLTTGVAMLVFALLWRRRSALDDAALMASALVGYATVIVGGWIWFLAPLAIFIVHQISWPRIGRGRVLSVQGVAAVSAGGLSWVFVHSVLRDAWLVMPFVTAMATTLAMFAASRPVRSGEPLIPPSRAWVSGLCAWLVVAAPVIAIAYQFEPSLETAPVRAVFVDLAFSLAAVLVATRAFMFVLPRSIPAHNALLLDLTYAAFGLAASLIPGFRWLLPA
jgi:phytol kinase